MAEKVIAGRYRLLEPLGKGAMSAVWLAEDRELGRQVAIKALGAKADRERFDREARAAAALSHAHICQLFDFGEAGGRPYMVLEYLSGGTLEDRLVGGTPLADDDVERITVEIASALAHAHGRGVVHRDLKPANVLFDGEGRAKIGDFGIAQVSGTGTLTETGTVLGTASYISPEQAAGLPATAASDVYSLAVIVFRMLTGGLPFRAKNPMEVVRMHRDDPPPGVSEIRPDAPARLAAFVDAALAKDPRGRPADGAAVLRELQGGDETATVVLARSTTLEADDSAAATQVVRRPPLPPRRGRRILPLALGGLLLLLVAGGVLAYVFTNEEETPSAPAPTTLDLPTIAPTETADASPATEPEPKPKPEPEETTAPPATTREPVTTRREPATTRAEPTTPPTTTAPAEIPPTPIVTEPPETTPTLPATTVAPTVSVPPVTTAVPETPTLPLGGGG